MEGEVEGSPEKVAVSASGTIKMGVPVAPGGGRDEEPLPLTLLLLLA